MRELCPGLRRVGVERPGAAVGGEGGGGAGEEGLGPHLAPPHHPRLHHLPRHSPHSHRKHSDHNNRKCEQRISDSETVLRRREAGLDLTTPLPPLVLCPDSDPRSQARRRVESQLPVLAHMWDTWDQVRAARSTRGDHLPWANDTREMRQFLGRVMYEGGRLASANCEDIIENCDNLKTDKIFTEAGVCLQVSPGTPTSNINIQRHITEKFHGTLETSIKQEFINQKELLQISVRLKSDSIRLGHPVVNMSYWGDSHLCDSQWGDLEAKVMCRELGFSSGGKFSPAQVAEGSPGVRYGPFLGRFQCSGLEERLTDCDRLELTGECHASPQLSLLLCDLGGLHGVHKRTKVHGYPYIEGHQGPEYFCEDDFGDSAAAVFCRMLGWRSGSVTVAGPGPLPPTRSLSCDGKLSQVLLSH